MDPAAASLVSYGYRNVQLLGSGSFGHVYRVLTRAGEVAAAKVASEPVAKRITLEETDVMKYIPPHPNVLQLHDVHTMGDSVVVLLAYASGGDTLKMMQERNLKPLCEGTARKLFRQLMSGLMHLHNAGVVHRDIKCENLLLTGPERRTLLIADFGYATHWRRGELLTDNVGSLHYCAPEVCAGRPYEGPEVDVWSAGVVLYAWATGRLPFGGATEEELCARIVVGEWQTPLSMSMELRDLLRGMIRTTVAMRATCADAAAHPWVVHPHKHHRHHHHHHHSQHHHHSSHHHRHDHKHPRHAGHHDKAGEETEVHEKKGSDIQREASSADDSASIDVCLPNVCSSSSLPEVHATAAGGRERLASHTVQETKAEAMVKSRSAEQHQHKHTNNLGALLNRFFKKRNATAAAPRAQRLLSVSSTAT